MKLIINSNLIQIIDRMEKRRLLNRRQSHGDKRSRIVEITTDGENLVQAVEDHTFTTISSNLDNLADVDIGGVIRNAMSLKKILNGDSTMEQIGE
jgi:DNA-binding MarR family transcriptional regulator